MNLLTGGSNSSLPGVETGTYGPLEPLARNRVNLNKVITIAVVQEPVENGGRHVSLHLAEQASQAPILALSHQSEPTDLCATVLPRLRALGAVSFGTEVTPQGRQVWALLDLAS